MNSKNKIEMPKKFDENDSKYGWDAPIGLGIFLAGAGILLYGTGVFLALFIS